MSYEIESQLVSDLSDEQQEVLTGGMDLAFAGDLGLSFTQFKAKQNTLVTTSKSGPNGSEVGGMGSSTYIDTKGIQLIKVGK